ncbi:hypothetical protein [Ralstonia syzygii]|uniref:hypothetical protein n=1 Tax=Ralstonia syzygii TaxID=28097 RepID=UPI001E3DFB16|nr:hypothetical protein [Ralstonia syzygii]
METPEQRSARRAMSAWLTKQVNNVAVPDGIATQAIRGQVLEALSEIDVRITELNRSLQENYHVVPGRDLVKFYMKGGNAFECIRNPQGPAATQNGGGASDWDTQIIIDPWAPLPLQAILYGLVEELVTDTMIQAGVDIAEVAGDLARLTREHWQGTQQRVGDRVNLDGTNYSAYALTYDDPQSLRKVFDQQRLGLWTNDRRPVSAPDIDHPERIPGILLNDAIRPFILHRLGYTWHAELDPKPPVQPNAGDIRKPVLMELIDVTLPRRDTIEAVAVWEELDQRQVTITEQEVQVNLPDGDFVHVLLPLPDIMYHLREIATMLCEIADGSSHHPDKLEKRFARFKLICDGSNQQQQQDILHALNAMAGVVDIGVNPPAHVGSVTHAIEEYGGALRQAILGDTDPAYSLARNLMDRIARGARGQGGGFTPDGHVSGSVLAQFGRTRTELGQWVTEAVARLPPTVAAGVRAAAYSDDLVLIRSLEQEKYLLPQQIGFSGVWGAVVIRVDTRSQLDTLGELFRSLLAGGPQHPDPTTSVRFRTYSVPRATGITHELTMVVFKQGKAVAYLSVTTASPGAAPLRFNESDPGVEFASLPEIALQRKVAAALIEDYLIRKVIARQYEALKTLLPVV